MALKAINEIKKVEEQAEEMIKQDHHQSKEIISKATLQADEEYKKIVDEGKKKAFEIINDAVLSGEKEAAILLKDGVKKCENIYNLSDDKIDKAIKLVIERVVNTDGNS